MTARLRSLLLEKDGPMLDVLKEAVGRELELPRKPEWHPDRERLAARLEKFTAEP